MDNKMNIKILTFLTALSNVYKDEENQETIIPLEFSSEEITEDFTALIYAFFAFYRKITADEDTDIVGFTHLLNSLIVQELLNKNESEVEE